MIIAEQVIGYVLDYFDHQSNPIPYRFYCHLMEEVNDDNFYFIIIMTDSDEAYQLTRRCNDHFEKDSRLMCYIILLGIM